MPYIESVCKAGRTKEIGKYYTHRHKPKEGKRNPKKNKTTVKQDEINKRNLERKLTRIMNANFDSSSWYVTFSYKKENRPDIPTLKSHKKELLKNLRKLYKKENKVFKYIETAEVGERGAMHIHMVISDIDTRKVRPLWKHGYPHFTPLDESGNYRKLAEYFIKYFQKTKGTDKAIQGKSYNCSRNLIRPEPKKKAVLRGRFRGRENIKIPNGWYLDKDSVRDGITEDGYEFLFYMLVQEVPIHRRI